ncbi:MAG: hypothetical protein L0271_01790, partial [Gemmatimonadetes bacterium]|nr:hypothetical protein [Gemmatimonadota bacterium]
MPMQLFGDVQPSTLTAPILRRVATAVATRAAIDIDQAIYRSLGTIRAPATQHPARPPAGQPYRWKVELTWEELSTWTVDAVLELATRDTPRELDYKPHDLEPIDALAELHTHARTDAESHARQPKAFRVLRPRTAALNIAAVAALLAPDYADGKRNDVAAGLAGYLAKEGVTLADAEAVMSKLASKDDDAGARSLGRVRSSYEAFADGVHVAGWTLLSKHVPQETLAELADIVDPRPTIQIRPALSAVTDEAIAALAAMPDLRVFNRARQLVTIARDGTSQETWLTRPPGQPVIVPVDQTRMLDLLDSCARWTSYNKRDKKWIPAEPPTRYATQVLGRLEWQLPWLESV